MLEFSGRGQRCTDIERQLVAGARLETLTEARQLWVLIAQRIGPDALMAVLDEVGGEKIHIPTRRDFFDTLYRPLRDAEIRRLRAEGLTLAQTAERVGVHPVTACAIANKPVRADT